MLIELNKSSEEICNLRQDAYLAAWPIHKQAEAILDNQVGKPEKLTKMREDFEQIRRRFPFT